MDAKKETVCKVLAEFIDDCKLNELDNCAGVDDNRDAMIDRFGHGWSTNVQRYIEESFMHRIDDDKTSRACAYAIWKHMMFGEYPDGWSEYQHERELEELAGGLNLDYDPEDVEQFGRELAEYIENEYTNEMRSRDAEPVIPGNAHAWASEYSRLIVRGEADATVDAVKQGIAEAVDEDCDGAEEIIHGEDLEGLYSQYQDDGKDGFHEWCRFELNEDEPRHDACYCMSRRDNIDKRAALCSVSLSDRRVWLHPKYREA